MKSHYHLFLFVFIGFVLAACSTTSHIPDNDKLYTGASVSVNGPNLSLREKKTLRSDLSALTRPRPNSKLLGIPFKLSFYNLFYNKKPNSFFGKLRDKWGEPPVLLSQLDLNKNVTILQNHLENKGYSHAKVTGDSSIRRKKATAIYKAETGVQYSIASVHFPSDSSDLSTTIQQSIPKTLLKVGTPFDLDVIKGERIRIDAFLKEKGFYYFNPEFLLIKADSTIGNNTVDLYVT